MGVIKNGDNLPRASFTPLAKKLSLCMASLIVLLSIGASHAWSFERVVSESINLKQNDVIDLTRRTPSPAVVDVCSSLLKSIRQTSHISATERSRPRVGKAAVFGLVLGIRYALPLSSKRKSKKPAISLELRQPTPVLAGNPYALSIAEYRKCRKEQALNSSLQALGDFRWAR